MSYRIGIIGAGHIGQALAKHLSKTGYSVMIANTRGAESLTNLVETIGGTLRAADLEETIKNSEVLFVAIPWGALKELAEQLTNYKGKIIVDATVNILSIVPLRLIDLKGKTSGEYTADLLKGHEVIKAFNTLPSAILAREPRTANGNTVIVLSGDNAEAKAKVVDIVKTMGFAPIDVGSLKEGGKLQDGGRAFSNVHLLKVG